jgi:hypothetical protein
MYVKDEGYKMSMGKVEQNMVDNMRGRKEVPIVCNVNCNSMNMYQGARPDQMNPNISGHGNQRNGAN